MRLEILIGLVGRVVLELLLHDVERRFFHFVPGEVHALTFGVVREPPKGIVLPGDFAIAAPLRV